MSRSTLAPRTRSFTELSTDRNDSAQSNRLRQTAEQRSPVDALRAPLTAYVGPHRREESVSSPVEIRPYESKDHAQVVALWSDVFPDDPPWNEPASMIR